MTRALCIRRGADWQALRVVVWGRGLSPGVALDPPAGSAPVPLPAGSSAGPPAPIDGWQLPRRAPAGPRACPGDDVPALPAPQPGTWSASQTPRPRRPALTSSGSGMTQRDGGSYLNTQKDTHLQVGSSSTNKEGEREGPSPGHKSPQWTRSLKAS